MCKHHSAMLTHVTATVCSGQCACMQVSEYEATRVEQVNRWIPWFYLLPYYSSKSSYTLFLSSYVYLISYCALLPKSMI